MSTVEWHYKCWIIEINENDEVAAVFTQDGSPLPAFTHEFFQDLVDDECATYEGIQQENEDYDQEDRLIGYDDPQENQ